MSQVAEGAQRGAERPRLLGLRGGMQALQLPHLSSSAAPRAQVCGDLGAAAVFPQGYSTIWVRNQQERATHQMRFKAARSTERAHV